MTIEKSTLKYGTKTYTLSEIADGTFNAGIESKIGKALSGGGLVWIETIDGTKLALGFPTSVEVVLTPATSSLKGRNQPKERKGVIL